MAAQSSASGPVSTLSAHTAGSPSFYVISETKMGHSGAEEGKHLVKAQKQRRRSAVPSRFDSLKEQRGADKKGMNVSELGPKKIIR